MNEETKIFFVKRYKKKKLQKKVLTKRLVCAIITKLSARERKASGEEPRGH